MMSLPEAVSTSPTIRAATSKTFLFRLFSSEGIEINYAPQVVSVSNHDTHLGDYDPSDFCYSMAKCLSENDTKSSSLVYDF